MSEVSDIEMEDGLAAIEALDLDAILDGIPLDSIAEAIVEEITAEPSAAPVAAKPKREKKATGPKAPKLKMKLEDLPEHTFQLMDWSEEWPKKKALELRPKAVKVAEKFDNLFFSIHANKKPSTFIVDCYAVIKSDPASMKDLVARLQAEGYSEGTARSQAQQCYALFKLLEVATETDKQLTRNPTSRIAHFLDNYCEQP